MRPRFPALLALAGIAIVLSACGKKSSTPVADAVLAPAEWAGIAARLVGPKGEQRGEVVVADAPSGVLMRVRVSGLTPGWHGIHLHMVADCSDMAAGFKESGGHVDPENHEHGLENAAGSERGDLPNIYADSNGDATAEFFRQGLNLNPSEQGAAANGPLTRTTDDSATTPVGSDRLAAPGAGPASGPDRPASPVTLILA